MSKKTFPHTRADIVRRAGWLAALGMAATAALAPAAQAASVTPIPISDDKNPTCSDFNPDWIQLKLEGDDLANGTYTDGTLTITISNFVESSGGTPGSFDWSSNIGVDAILVKAGDDKHNLYVYDPESTGDTGLEPQAGTGNGISHLSICYDVEQASTPPSEAPSTPPSVAPSVPPSVPPSVAPSAPPSGSELPVVGTPTPAPTGGVAGATGTPGVTPPPTDTELAAAAQAGNDGWRMALMLIAGVLAGTLVATQPRKVRQKN